MVTLATPLRQVLGGRTAAALDRGLDLQTVGDLLRHYPRRYAERGELTDLADLRVGDQVTVLAEVRRVHRRPMRNRRGSLLAVPASSTVPTISCSARTPTPRWWRSSQAR